MYEKNINIVTLHLLFYIQNPRGNSLQIFDMKKVPYYYDVG